MGSSGRAQSPPPLPSPRAVSPTPVAPAAADAAAASTVAGSAGAASNGSGETSKRRMRRKTFSPVAVCSAAASSSNGCGETNIARGDTNRGNGYIPNGNGDTSAAGSGETSQRRMRGKTFLPGGQSPEVARWPSAPTPTEGRGATDCGSGDTPNSSGETSRRRMRRKTFLPSSRAPNQGTVASRRPQTSASPDGAPAATSSASSAYDRPPGASSGSSNVAQSAEADPKRKGLFGLSLGRSAPSAPAAPPSIDVSPSQASSTATSLRVPSLRRMLTRSSPPSTASLPRDSSASVASPSIRADSFAMSGHI